MATITASLERSLQNCSLNQTSSRGRSSSSSTTTTPSNSSDHHNHTRNRGYHLHNNNQDLPTNSNASSSDDNSTFVELNSHVSLPYHWEQCLDLKTGELYYINWSNGMKSKDDPRTTAVGYSGDYYSEEEEEDDDDEDSNGYDSEGSSTETSSSSSTNFRTLKKPLGSGSYARHQRQEEIISQDSVLVVAGCKSCLMYHMVPKHVEDCPKCSGQLLHFAANNPPNSNSSP